MFEGLPEKLFSFEENETSVLSSDSSETTVSNVHFTLSSLHQLFSQKELNYLTRDLNLSKESSKVLASTLKEKNLLQAGTLITFYRKRHSEFLPSFTQQNDIVSCNDVASLLRLLGVQQCKPQSWRFFIDISKEAKNVFFFTTETFTGQFFLSIQKPARKNMMKSNPFRKNFHTNSTNGSCVSI